VDGHELGDLGAAVAELDAGSSWLHDRHAGPERRDLLGDRLHDPRYQPSQRGTSSSRERDLPPPRGGDLNDAAATLGTEVREGRADELDRPHQVGRDRVVDLGVVSRGCGSHRTNRAKSWTFQRTGALHQTLPLGVILVVSSFGA
jgi:hypothetical protein